MKITRLRAWRFHRIQFIPHPTNGSFRLLYIRNLNSLDNVNQLSPIFIDY